MAEKSFELRIVTPERCFFSGEVLEVVVDAIDGREGYLARHAPVMKFLKEGDAKIVIPGEKRGDANIERELHISGGNLTAGEKIIIYTPKAEWRK